MWRSRGLVGGNDELGVGVAAHAVDGAGSACTNRIGVAAGMFGDDSDGTIRTAHDGALVIERIGAAEVNNEAGVLGSAHKSNAGAHFNAEGFVFLGTGNAWGRSGVGTLAALDVDGTGRRSRAASVGRGANASGIGSRTDVVFDFVLGVLAIDEAGQEKRKDEQTTENSKIAVNLH